MARLHNHKCSCGTVWCHDPDAIPNDSRHHDAHCCPKCGREQYEKYLGSKSLPQFCHNGARTLALTEDSPQVKFFKPVDFARLWGLG